MENFKDLEVGSLEDEIIFIYPVNKCYAFIDVFFFHYIYAHAHAFVFSAWLRTLAPLAWLVMMTLPPFCAVRSHSGRGRWWSSATPNTKKSSGTYSTNWTSPSAESKSAEYDAHTCRQMQFCTSQQQPTPFLFQSLIALLCSNTSGLDKDSLTLSAIYESNSPTPVPVCALHRISTCMNK